MNKRIEFQKKLEDILGTRAVYFQPPENKKLDFPCIIYSINNVDTRSANNAKYRIQNRYKVMLITTDPDSIVCDKLMRMTYSSFDTHYTAKDTHHFVYNIYY